MKPDLVSDVSLGRRVTILFLGKAYAFNVGEMEFYYSKCGKHGYYVTYEQGFDHELRCPACIKCRGGEETE